MVNRAWRRRGLISGAAPAAQHSAAAAMACLVNTGSRDHDAFRVPFRGAGGGTATFVLSRLTDLFSATMVHLSGGRGVYQLASKGVMIERGSGGVSTWAYADARNNDMRRVAACLITPECYDAWLNSGVVDAGEEENQTFHLHMRAKGAVAYESVLSYGVIRVSTREFPSAPVLEWERVAASGDGAEVLQLPFADPATATCSIVVSRRSTLLCSTVIQVGWMRHQVVGQQVMGQDPCGFYSSGRFYGADAHTNADLLRLIETVERARGLPGLGVSRLLTKSDEFVANWMRVADKHDAPASRRMVEALPGASMRVIYANHLCDAGPDVSCVWLSAGMRLTQFAVDGFELKTRIHRVNVLTREVAVFENSLILDTVLMYQPRGGAFDGGPTAA